jgi:hypothetical protein
MNPALHTSHTDLYSTPQEFFDALNDEFSFDLTRMG